MLFEIDIPLRPVPPRAAILRRQVGVLLRLHQPEMPRRAARSPARAAPARAAARDRARKAFAHQVGVALRRRPGSAIAPTTSKPSASRAQPSAIAAAVCAMPLRADDKHDRQAGQRGKRRGRAGAARRRRRRAPSRLRRRRCPRRSPQARQPRVERLRRHRPGIEIDRRPRRSPLRGISGRCSPARTSPRRRASPRAAQRARSARARPSSCRNGSPPRRRSGRARSSAVRRFSLRRSPRPSGSATSTRPASAPSQSSAGAHAHHLADDDDRRRLDAARRDVRRGRAERRLQHALLVRRRVADDGDRLVGARPAAISALGDLRRDASSPCT